MRSVRRRGGFTLIELLVVIAIMAAVLALAAPHLLPTLLYTTHEGAARHLANFGTAAIADAELNRRTLTFKFDFATNEYWVETIPVVPEEDKDAQNTAFGDPTKDANGFPKDDAELQQMAAAELEKQVPQGTKRTETGSKLLDEQAKRMAQASFKRERSLLGARADRVKQDDKVLPKSQQKTNNGLTSPTTEKVEPVEVRTAVLNRTKLPSEIKLAMASIGGNDINKGVVEVEITPAGLEVEAKFWLMNAEGKTFVVTWDPATGRTTAEQDTGQK